MTNNESLKRGIAIALSGYARRWMESGVYDRLMNTELGKQLKELDPKAKYGIEGGLYVLTAILEQKFGEDTALKVLVRELGMDAGPEIAKRMINGSEVQPQSSATTAHARPTALGSGQLALLALNQDELSELLLWLSSIEMERRQRLIVGIARLTSEELSKFMALEKQGRERFAQYFIGIEDEATFKRVMSKAEDAKVRFLNGLHDSLLKLRLGSEYGAIVDTQPEAAERNALLYSAMLEKQNREKQDRKTQADRRYAASSRSVATLWILLGIAIVAMVILNS